VPAILIDSANITPPSSSAGPAAAEPTDSANGGQSFKSTLDKEMRNQAPENKSEARTAKADKKDDKQGEDGVTVASPPEGSTNPPDLSALQIPLTAAVAAQQAGMANTDAQDLSDSLRPKQGIAANLKDGTIPAPATLASRVAHDGVARDAKDVSKLQPGQKKEPDTKAAELPRGMVLAPVQNEQAATGKSVEHAQPEKPAIAQVAAAVSRNGDQPKIQEAIKHDPASLLAADMRSVVNQNTAPIQPQAMTSQSVTRIDAHVGSDAWNNALGQQVVMMVTEKQQLAEIHLNPQDMGPIKVTVTLDNNQASLSFMVREGATRDAIQSALPRLNEMMAESGISLGQTNVQADTSGSFGQSAQPGAPGSRIPNQIEPDNAIAIPQAAVRTITRHGLVDTFA
jgi:flagellar hook-length control protein FliK